MGDFNWAVFNEGLLPDEYRDVEGWQTYHITDIPFGSLLIEKDKITHKINFFGNIHVEEINFTGTAYFIGMKHDKGFVEISVDFVDGKFVKVERMLFEESQEG